MKLLALIALIAGLGWAAETVSRGQKTVATSYVRWDPGSSDADTTYKIYLINSQILADSSGTLKRIDNTADSCSYPFNIGSDAFGSTHPIWYQAIFPLITTDDNPDSLGFRVETRNSLSYLTTGGIYKLYYDVWIPQGSKAGSANNSVDDSIAVLTPAANVTVRQELQFSVSGGDQARLCPSDFGSGATDTTIIDSTYYKGR